MTLLYQRKNPIKDNSDNAEISVRKIVNDITTPSFLNSDGIYTQSPLTTYQCDYIGEWVLEIGLIFGY